MLFYIFLIVILFYYYFGSILFYCNVAEQNSLARVGLEKIKVFLSRCYKVSGKWTKDSR